MGNTQAQHFRMKMVCVLFFMLLIMASTAYCKDVEYQPSQNDGKGRHYKPELARFTTSDSTPTIAEGSSLKDCVSYMEELAEAGYDTDNEDYVPKTCCKFFKKLGNEESEAYICTNVKKIFAKEGNFYAFVEAGLGIVAKCKNKSPAAFSCEGKH